MGWTKSKELPGHTNLATDEDYRTLDTRNRSGPAAIVRSKMVGKSFVYVIFQYGTDIYWAAWLNFAS
jgi:hypothetical protein